MVTEPESAGYVKVRSDIMKYTETQQSLFELADDYYLVHCVSRDFALGAGIATEFNRRYDMRNKLQRLVPKNSYPNCVLIENIFNLITKAKAWQKPTMKTMDNALVTMRTFVEARKVKKSLCQK